MTEAHAPRPRDPRVLLVDDSATMRLYLSRLLKELFPRALLVEAEDGREALRRLTLDAFDLVVTDLKMPGMDGLSLVQILKRNPLLRRKPVLVVTASPEEARPGVFASSEALRCLAKPVSKPDFDAAVLALLEEAEATGRPGKEEALPV